MQLAADCRAHELYQQRLMELLAASMRAVPALAPFQVGRPKEKLLPCYPKRGKFGSMHVTVTVLLCGDACTRAPLCMHAAVQAETHALLLCASRGK